jgi:hypothetical protein
MSHYDSCREADKWTEGKREAYSYYGVELNQLGSAVELIKAIANGLGVDGFEGLPPMTTPAQACDRWLMDNGYECEATRQAQKQKKLKQLNDEIARLEQERDAL